MSQDNGILKVTTLPLIKTLTVILTRTDLVPLVLGPAGIGKSSIGRQLAESLFNNVMIDIRLGQMQEEDLIGIPHIKDGRTSYALPFFWPTEGSGLMFFDEPNRATKGMLQCLFQLVLDKQYFNYVFPKEWRMLFAGNWGEANYFVQELDPALRNRFVTIYYTGPTYDEWKQWALANGIAHEIISFLGIHRNLLLTEATDDKPYPTCRSWEQASHILKATDDKETRKIALSGVIGLEAAIMLLNYIDKQYEALPDPSDLKYAGDIIDRWRQKGKNDRIAAFLDTIIDYVAEGGTYSIEEFNRFAGRLPRDFMFSLFKGLHENEKTCDFAASCLSEDDSLLNILSNRKAA